MLGRQHQDVDLARAAVPAARKSRVSCPSFLELCQTVPRWIADKDAVEDALAIGEARPDQAQERLFAALAGDDGRVGCMFGWMCGGPGAQPALPEPHCMTLLVDC